MLLGRLGGVGLKS